MHIFVDAMGGDNAPKAPVEGALEALRRYPELKVTLAGDLAQVEPLLTGCDDVRGRITLVDAPEVITNDESPVMGVRQKKNSATVIGMLQLRDKEVDGFVSAGSTGAVLAGGMFRLGRIPGVERPALAPLMPNGKGYFLLIDCGANVDCKPEYLQQFGVMGDAYMKGVMGLEKPRVGLINIGAESEKGNALVKAVYPLMEQAGYHFIGNVEARDITGDQADVLVCDG
ncbi:MAG: phosphate acyltransferase, partial [Clostridia bacterium]|nr:phosphate acyltransferase [Clostridia bacterium]